MDNLQIFSENIKNYRAHLGMNQDDFGAFIGTKNRHAVTNYERAKNFPGFRVLRKLADESGYTVTDWKTKKLDFELKISDVDKSKEVSGEKNEILELFSQYLGKKLEVVDDLDKRVTGEIEARMAGDGKLRQSIEDLYKDLKKDMEAMETRIMERIEKLVSR